ncbi:hypothetical protein [Acetobacter papayae]|nr:hypothetical protein [Acetobacter papayae]
MALVNFAATTDNFQKSSFKRADITIGQAADGHLALAFACTVIDCKTRAIGAALGHGFQHLGRQTPQFRLKRPVFDKQSYDAAHRKPPKSMEQLSPYNQKTKRCVNGKE